MYTPTQQMLRWIVLFTIFCLVCYFFRSIIGPYIFGMAIAYFLDPVADWLEAHGFKRVIATAIIAVIVLVIVTLILFVGIPVAARQIMSLIENLPEYVDALGTYLRTRFSWFTDVESGITERIQNSSEAIVDSISNWVFSSTQTIFGIISAFIIIPIVAFYMLIDWDRMVAIVDGWVPRDYLATYRRVTSQINTSLSGFVRGQGTVCIVMAIYYSTVLTLVGLNYGFAIGVLAGFLTFIPLVGGLVAGFLVIVVGAFQFWGDWGYYAFVLIVYYAGQTFEGNVLTPRLVGNSVGLHPVWIMFALSAGAVVAGLTGMLVAVPVAAAFGVLARQLITVYKRGPLYLGDDFDEETYQEQIREARKLDG